jgi:hypothetical protein
MSGTAHVRTPHIGELLGPAEGQYVIQAMLGTGPEGQSQNTGMDIFRISATEPAASVCFDIDWTPGPGRVVYALLYKTDCAPFFLENSDDDGHFGGCVPEEYLPLPAGEYEVRVMNPMDDGSEVSFPYTISMEISVPFTFQPFGNEVQPEENEPCP